MTTYKIQDELSAMMASIVYRVRDCQADPMLIAEARMSGKCLFCSDNDAVLISKQAERMSSLFGLEIKESDMCWDCYECVSNSIPYVSY